MGEDRSWMYNERKGSLFSPVWKAGLDTFLDHAFSLPEAAKDGRSKCPCTKCDRATSGNGMKWRCIYAAMVSSWGMRDGLGMGSLM